MSQFYVSQEELFVSYHARERLYLCSSPALMPSFVVRAPSQEEAVATMRKLLDCLFRGQPFSFPGTVPAGVVGYQGGEGGVSWYLAECETTFPGLRAFGLNQQEAGQQLLGLFREMLDSGCWQHRLNLAALGRGAASSCPELLPHVQVCAESKEAAYNEMARRVLDHGIRQKLMSQFDAPIIVTGAFHSGTSAVARLLLVNNVCLGTNLNYALDEVGVNDGEYGVGPFAGLREVIEQYYPQRLEELPVSELALLREYFFRLVKDKIAFPHWGWKAPTNTFLIPLLAQVFPGARFIQVIRDGRDVALSPHSEFPNNPFGKLLYFDRTDIEEWRGIRLTPELGAGLQSGSFEPPPSQRECELMAHLWEKMTRLGERFGEQLGEKRYLQVRFESLCLAPEREVTRISEFLGIPLRHDLMEWRTDRVGKYRQPPAWAAAPGFMAAIEAGCRQGLVDFDYPLEVEA